MNLASIVVLGLVAGLAVAALISLRRERGGGCGGDCGSCGLSCHRGQKR